MEKSGNKTRVLPLILRLSIEMFFVTAVVLLAIHIFGYVDERSYLLDSRSIELGKSYPIATDTKTLVLGEKIEATEDMPVLKSQNYQIKHVAFGGDTTIPLDRIENVPLKVLDVRSELLTTRNEQEAKLIVSWKTNKPAISKIVYGKNIEQGGIEVKESKYGYTHSAIFSSLDYSSAYTYLIKSKDKWNNESASEQFAFYTGAPKISLIDLLLGAFKDVFSWAIKK
ncbi:MAG: hypothetical protein U9M90_01475 [Patescibacteria group bacterium]|nr:hypothetical protein [Patescibacteria group bacterium]